MRKVHRVARTGLATFLFARSQHARAVTMDANALRLEYGSRSSETSLGKIESAEIKTGWIWSRVQLRHDGGESVVSGLSSDDAQDFAKALESARTRWWQRELAPQTGILRSVCDGLGVCAVGRLAPRKTGDVLPKVQPGIPDGISGNGRFQIPASARFSIVRVRVLSRFPDINPPVAFASA